MCVQQSKLSSTRKQLEQEYEQKQRELRRLLDALGELTLDCDDLVNKLADVYVQYEFIHCTVLLHECSEYKCVIQVGRRARDCREARSAQCEQQTSKFGADIDKVERQILLSDEERKQIDGSLVEAQRVFQAEERRAREAEKKLKARTHLPPATATASVAVALTTEPLTRSVRAALVLLKNTVEELHSL